MSMAAVLAAAALAANIPPTLLQAVCWVESHHNPHALNVKDGNSASYSLCQVKLATAKMFLPEVTPPQLMQPEMNAALAARYLAYQMKRYGGNEVCAVVAYNKGNAKKLCPSFDFTITFDQALYSRKVFAARKEKPWLATNQNVRSKNQALPKNALSSISELSGL